MNLMDLVLELEDEVSDKRGFFSKKVDLDKCYQLVQSLKANLPEALDESKVIADNRKKILDNADNVAKNTIREAEERALHIVDNSEIIKRAEADAKQIMEKTYMQCDALIQRTKDHLDNMFRETEQFLLSTLNMIRNNREELRGAMIINQVKSK